VSVGENEWPVDSIEKIVFSSSDSSIFGVVGYDCSFRVFQIVDNNKKMNI
jgi:hypothetical protein